jgi:hypothetical protein
MAKKEENFKEFAGILNGMANYVFGEHRHFYISPKLGYCPACESITCVVGDYGRHDGDDCSGSHYSVVKENNHCLECKTTKFIPISVYNLGVLDKTGPEKLINAIEKGLKEMNSPGLYNKNLPKVIKEWKKIPYEEKVNQILLLSTHLEKIKKTKEEFGSLEKTLKSSYE